MDYIDIIVAFIAGGFSIFVLSSNKKGEFVTNDREKWRAFMRDWIADTTLIVQKVSAQECKGNYKNNFESLLDSQKNAIISRLNPIRDLILINKIGDLKLGDIDNLKDICDDISTLLKYDRERVKKDTSLLGDTLLLNVFFIITVAKIIGVSIVQQSA